MRFYIFKSETRKALRAFAGDQGGTKLPGHHGPWTATGVVAAEKAPPHNFSREAIEEAIEGEGFQLWRMRDKKSESRDKKSES
jgi:hypothetical protein